MENSNAHHQNPHRGSRRPARLPRHRRSGHGRHRRPGRLGTARRLNPSCTPGSTYAGNHLTDDQLALYARDAGFTGGGLEISIAVALAESNAWTKALLVNTNCTRDRGLWQINDYWHPEVSDKQAFNPVDNAAAAYRISSQGSNWQPWSAYKNGAYQRYLARAQQAVRNISRPVPDFSQDAPAAVVASNDAMQVFARDSYNGDLTSSWQSAKGSLWSGWTAIGQGAAGTPAARIDALGQKDVFFRRADGHLIEIWQDGPLGPMNKFADLGGDFAGDPVVVAKADGTKIVFIRGTDGQLWNKWQDVPGGAFGLSALVRPDLGQITGKPSVLIDDQGQMVVFATRADGHLITTWQSAPGTAFDMLADLGGDFAGDPAAIRKPDGTMIVFIRGTDGQLWNKWQDVPRGAFGLSALVRPDLGQIMGKPAILLDASNQVNVFARRADGHLITAWQASPGGVFAGQADLGGNLVADPTVVTQTDGTKIAYTRFNDGSVMTAWQTGPGSAFSGWFFLNTN